MKADNINKVKKILQLEREIIGVKFIHYKEQYDKEVIPYMRNWPLMKMAMCPPAM